MIRRYCDVCGEEVKRSYVSDRLLKWFDGKNKMGVEIILGLNGTWNDGEFCLNCIQKAVNRLIAEGKTELGGQ